MTEKEELAYLRSRSKFLDCLNYAGVSKWEGYTAALEYFEEDFDTEEEFNDATENFINDWREEDED